jgi:hypothetical protein
LVNQVFLGQMPSSQVRVICKGRMSCAFARFCAVHLHTTDTGDLNCDSLVVIDNFLTYLTNSEAHCVGSATTAKYRVA